MRRIVLGALFLCLFVTMAGAQTGIVLAPPRNPAADTLWAQVVVHKGEDARAALAAGTPVIRFAQQEMKRIRIYADGNIRQAISKATGTAPDAVSAEDKTAATTRLGIASDNLSSGTTVSGLISVASTLKHVQDNYVTTVLVPGGGDGLHSAVIEYRGRIAGNRGCKVLCALARDYHVYAAVASSDWSFSPDTTYNAVSMGAGLLRVLPLTTDESTEPSLSMALEAGLSYRHIGGDITLPRNEAYLEKAIGTRQQDFIGAEGGLQIAVGEVSANFHVYSYIKRGDGVPGLSRAQVVAMINVRGALYTRRVPHQKT
ncbi:MAG: hypothetical protein ABI960_00655 [Candidatus Eisenbacteria bacterium]